jgi:sugar phosphate isomerase/epimerase
MKNIDYARGSTVSERRRNFLTHNPGELSVKLNRAMADILAQVHVNMPWKFLPDYLEMVLELRINVEIGLEAEQLDGVPRSLFRSVAEQLHQRGCRITLHGPFWDLCPGSTDAIIRQVSQFRLHQLFDLVEVFRPVQVVCHTGFDPRHHGSDHESYLGRSVAIWEPLVTRAAASRVPLLLENVWEYGPELHRELLVALNSPYCRFCLDVGHQHSFSKTPLSSWVETLGDYLDEIHVHDNGGVRDDHLPVGHGTIDFALLFRLLRSKAISPLLTLEPHREEHLAESLAGLVRVMGVDGKTMTD